MRHRALPPTFFVLLLAAGIGGCTEDDAGGLGGDVVRPPQGTAIDATGDRETPPAGAARLTPGAGGGDVGPTPFADDATIIQSDDPGRTEFEPDNFRVAPGEDVSVVYVNNTPEGHSLHIFDGDTPDAETLAQTETMVGPGASASVEFTAPSQPGDYFFWCDVHTNLMTGTMTVE